MGSSAESNSPRRARLGSDADASHSDAAPRKDAAAPFEASPLSIDEAERLASSFKPSWESDDASFTPAPALSASDIIPVESTPSLEASSARPPNVAPVAPPVATAPILSASAALAQFPVPAPPAHVLAPSAARPPIVARAPVAAPPARGPARAQDPFPISADSSVDFLPVRKSNKKIVLGAVAAVALIAGIFGVRSLTTEAPTPLPSAAPTRAEERVVPPPPPATEVAPTPPPPPPAKRPEVPAATVATVPPVRPALPRPASETHALPRSSPRAAAPQSPRQPAEGRTATPRPSKAGSTIVRDNPF